MKLNLNKNLINPIGKANLELIKDKIENLFNEWKEQIGQIPWYKWWIIAKTYWVQAIYFLLRVTDELILFVESMIPEGVDKKATVLAGIALLWDRIVSPLLPIWLKPFNSKFKDFIISVVISLMVDFMVSKYNTKEWIPDEPDNVST